VAGEGNLTVRQWIDPSVDEIVSAYASMELLKGLEEQHSREEFMHLLTNFEQQLVIYRGDDEQGELVSLRGWLVFGNRAIDVLSATTERGRELRASYAVTWALIHHCRLLHLEACDLGGIDPVLNPGVYRFKKGTGAAPIEFLGEWDWASRPWLRWLGNWAISRRQRLKIAESTLNGSSRNAPSNSLSGDRRQPAEISQARIV
jgi:lipid II:glycine glycyltransferase (peptidoglycan interpeptide bridge formation enzyme)